MEDAAVLWLQRDEAVNQPHFQLASLFDIDDRLEANLDGIRIADQDQPGAGWEVCRRELQWSEPGEVFTAAVLALESGVKDRVQCVLDAARGSSENTRGLVSALGWLPYDMVVAVLAEWLESADVFLRRVATAAKAAHGYGSGQALDEAIRSGEPQLCATALLAAGKLARLDLLDLAAEYLGAQEPCCRFAAAWTVTRLSSNPVAIDVLKSFAESRDGYAERAMQLVVRVLPIGEARAWATGLTRHVATERLGVQAFGALGLPCVPELLDGMAKPATARVAGESFALITGVDLAHEGFEGNMPDGGDAGPIEDPADEHVAMDPDENLPWPNLVKLTEWWQRYATKFDAETRYLCGNVIGHDTLRRVLHDGYQRQRAAAALEQAVLLPHQPLFNVKAPGRRQKKMLDAL